MSWLSTKFDDAPPSEVMMNFSGPGVAEPARKERPMPDGGDSMALYDVGESWDVTATDEALTGAGKVVAGAGAMAGGEDVQLAVTLPVLVSSP